MNRPKYNKYLNIHPSNNLRKTFRKNVIFVEGVNDKIIFDSIVKNNWIVMIYEYNPLNNKKKSILEDFKKNYINNQIAVVDKDYDENFNVKNVYYTDYNDIENTAINLMNTNEIKKSLNFNENFSDEYFNNEIYKPVINISIMFSNLWEYFRKKDIKKEYILNNKNYIPFLTRVIDSKKMEIKYHELKKIYKDKSNINNIDYKNIMNRKSNYNYLRFRGHDFFRIFEYFINSNNIKINIINNQDIERKFIENSLSYQWIFKSSLYKNINKEFKDCFKNEIC